MKTCLICPIPDLDTFVDEKATHHLLLSHLMGDPRYLNFYVGRGLAGDYIIVDNGAKENGTGLGLGQLLEDAYNVGASEVVLTDVRYKCPETVAAGRGELEWLKSDQGRAAYKRAGYPRLMIVPQGQTVSQWEFCLQSLLETVEVAREDITEMAPPTIGLAYHYDHLFEGGLLGLFEVAPEINSFEVHMLGWPRRLNTLRTVAAVHNVRSVDSGRPFSYALARRDVGGFQEHIKRPEDFFDEAIPEDRYDLVRANIEIFRTFAGDPVAV